MGMAVDAKGNLYVANHGANQILVYNSSSQQMTSKTITKSQHAKCPKWVACLRLPFMRKSWREERIPICAPFL